MNFLPFHPSHLLMLECVEEEAALKDSFSNPFLARQYMVPGFSMSAVDKGYMAACFGLVPVWQGRAFLWIVFDKDIGPKRFSAVVKRGNDILDNMVGTYFDRIEAYVQEDYGKAARLAELFKFKREGLMEKFMANKNFILYSRTK